MMCPIYLFKDLYFENYLILFDRKQVHEEQNDSLPPCQLYHICICNEECHLNLIRKNIFQLCNYSKSIDTCLGGNTYNLTVFVKLIYL